VGWWTGQGNANDSVNTNHGIMEAGVAFTAGEVNQAFSFNGVDASLRMPTSPSLNVGLGNGFTFETWINPADVTSWHPLAEWNSGSVGVNISVAGLNPGTLFMSVKDIGLVDHYIVTATGVLSSNVFQHVATTYDKPSGIAALYIDGTLMAQQTLGSFTPMTVGDLNIALRPFDGGAGTRFVGLVDEISLYDRALTGAEIAAIYNAGAAGKCSSPAAPFIYLQPTNATVYAGANYTFTTLVGGAAPLIYQWQRDGTNILGATDATLTLINIQPSQAGTYILRITNSVGTTTSSNAVLTVQPGPGCVPAPSGLVSWWPGEGNANDIISTNHGIMEAGLTFTAGEVNQAFKFNGTSASLRMPASPSLNVGLGGGFTIETWIKPADLGNPLPIAEWNSGSFGVNFYTSAYSSGSLFISVKDVNLNEHQVFTGDGLLNTNSMQNVAATYDKSSGITVLYLNGAIVAQDTFGVFTPLTSGDFNIGLRPYGPGAGRRFMGVMDEFSLYDRALTGAEIAAIYNAGAVGKCFVQTAPFISLQPSNATVLMGANHSFSALAGGTAPLSYQWRFNGGNISGATNTTLTLTNVLPSKAGLYSVRVTNAVGEVTSSNASLNVIALFAYGNGQPLTNVHTFNGAVSIQIQSTFTNGLNFYTLDGSQPTFLSAAYTGPFVVSNTVTLRVLGYSADFFEFSELGPVSVLLPPTYLLTGSTAGGGTIAFNPPGGSYFTNTIVSVTATPAAGWTFLQWLGDLAGSNTQASVTMTRNKRVQAVFGTALNTTAAGGGSVTKIPASGLHPFGSIVTLVPVPQSGKYFGIWGNAASGNANPLYFTVTNTNQTVSSLFASLSGGQAALAVVPNGFGTVAVNPQANAYNVGAGVTLTAVPDLGQIFLGWSGDATGNSNPLGITMTTSKTIIANFSSSARLTAVPPLEGVFNDGFRFTLHGEYNRNYQIDVSTNLPDWSSLAVLTNYYDQVQFLDVAATNGPIRLYRALRLP
jgi:hypothetical protein